MHEHKPTEIEEEVEFEDEDEDEDEVIDDDTDDANDDVTYVPRLPTLTQVRNTFEALVAPERFPVEISECISVAIPTFAIPILFQRNFGFSSNPILLQVKIPLDINWEFFPSKLFISSPIFGQSFPGSSLVNSAMQKFFSSHYTPKKCYHSAFSTLSISSCFKPEILPLINSKYPDKILFQNILSITESILVNAQRMLFHGWPPASVPYTYESCPLLYLVMEIIDSLFSLDRHCFICGVQLENFVSYPTLCCRSFCRNGTPIDNARFMNLVTLSSPEVVSDFVITCFALSLTGDFFNLPKKMTLKQATNIILDLPAVSEIAAGDGSVRQLLDSIFLKLKSKVLNVPKMCRIVELDDFHQFYIVNHTEDKEYKFQTKKKKYGRMWLWHGAPANRWFSIIDNGLKIYSQTSGMHSGAKYGNGIYLACHMSSSLLYSNTSENLYKNSIFGKDISIISLCEVAKGPHLQQIGSEFILTDEDAVVTRFLFVLIPKHTPSVSVLNLDLSTESFKKLPTLEEIIQTEEEVLNAGY